MERLALSVEEAAARWGLSRASLYPIVMSGQIRSVTIGKRRLVPVAALEEWFVRIQNERPAD